MGVPHIRNLTDAEYDATVRDRIMARSRQDDSGCWLWTGFMRPDGYANSRYKWHKTLAHRVSYMAFKGPIPEGLVIDHICRVRHCVNPEHLRAITFRENVLIGISPTARHARQTHCLRGHPLSGDNVYLWHDKLGRTGRICRSCRREYIRNRNATRRAAA